MFRAWEMPEKEGSIGEAIRAIIKHILGHLCVYKLTEKPIFIFSNRRGGSTLLMEMIYSQPGVDYVAQPLDLWQFHPHFNRLPHPPRSKFISLSNEDEERLKIYFKDLLSGRVRLRNQWRIFSSNYSLFVHRLVVKVCNANALIDWFNEHFDIHCIYLVRHPIPVALSIINRGWANEAKAYLENENFRRNELNPEIVDFGKRLLQRGTLLQRYVLEWCLENLYPLRVFQNRPWLTLTYEEVVLRPQEISKMICQRFDLPDPVRMHETTTRPSRTTTRDSKTAIKKQGPRILIERWLQKVTPKEIAEVQEVLDAFGIWAYKASSAYPDPKLCHFGPLQSIAGEEK